MSSCGVCSRRLRTPCVFRWFHTSSSGLSSEGVRRHGRTAQGGRPFDDTNSCDRFRPVRELRAIADEFFGALLTPVLQRAVRSAADCATSASALVRHLPRRDAERRPGDRQRSPPPGGTTVPVTTPYYREKHARRVEAEAGTLPRLGGAGHLRPVHAEAGLRLQAARSAMLSSLGGSAGAAPLRRHRPGYQDPPLDRLSLRCARATERPSRARRAVCWTALTGKRVVVSLDGGRVRVRRKKRGPKTKKGRNRFHTDWKEPKLLILYVVGDDGRPSQTWAPIIDGTLRGPEAVFALLLSYARQSGLNAADKVLFIADGAPWIWQRIQRLIAALGLSPTQVLGLIDFYHAAKQLSDAVKLRRWSATQRTRWLNRTRGLLKRARVDEAITALRELCAGARPARSARTSTTS